MNNVLYTLSGMLLFLSILLPTTLSIVKIVLLLLLLFSCMFACKNAYSLSRHMVLLILFYSAIGILWVLYGAIRGNPGYLSMSTVLIFYPIIFGILSGLYKERLNEELYKLFIYSAWFLSVITLLIIIDFIWLHFGLFDIATGLYDLDSVVVDNSSGYFKFTIPNISSLIFLIPFLISAIFFRKPPKKHYILLLLLCVLAILSGRRALMLTMFLAPVLAVVITSDRLSNNKIFCRFLLVFVLIGMAIYLFYIAYPDYFIDRVTNILNFDSNTSNLERKYQFDALMAGFYEHPLFGNGAGAAASYLRSDSQPWAYELSYIAFLFQFGLVGFFIYLMGILFIIYTLIRRVKFVGRNSMEFCFLSGFISFMIANATNPYLLKFDYMWLIFIPLGIANSILVKK